MRLNPALTAAAVLLAVAGPVWAQDKPRDDATRKFFFNPDSEISASELLAAWGKTFNALVIEDQQVGQARIKFVTGVQTELSWGATKKILDFYEVMVVEDQPTANGPWVIRAHSKRNIGQKEPPPWRYVDADENEIPDHDEIVTAVFKIKYGAGNAIFATIRGLATRDTSRVSNSLYVPGPEVIIISDLASRVRYYARVIEALDVQGPRKEMRIYQIQHAPVEELAQILTAVLQALAGSGAGGGQAGVQIQPQGAGAAAGAPTVISDPRSNRLIVAAFPDDLRLVELVKQELDVRVAPPSGRFHVYKCKDADAEYLAGKIQELFTGQAAPTSTSGGGASGTVRSGNSSVSGSVGGAGVATLSEGTGIGDVDTRIVADERTNSLLIQAEERAYEEILEVLAQLDKKRRRVLIEAQIWEVSEPDSLSIGFELATLTNAHDGSIRPSAASGFGGSSFQPVTNANGDTDLARGSRTRSPPAAVRPSACSRCTPRTRSIACRSSPARWRPTPRPA
ncbi:MAG: secretin N-terminal domain-containing protein [Planctomycetota bacterium]